MNFGEIFGYIMQGAQARRAGWDGPDEWIQAQFPDEHSKMTAPYLFLSNQQGDLVPWFASQGDLFGSDWEIVD